MPEAIAAHRKATELDPNDATGFNNLGNALHAQKSLSEAIVAFKKATRLDPKNALLHLHLGIALRDHGSFGAAAVAIQKALELPPIGRWSRGSIQTLLHECQHLLNLDNALSATLENPERTVPGRLLEMALMCQQYKKHHVSAVRLYQEAFRTQSALADDLHKSHRYNAACAAVLAG